MRHLSALNRCKGAVSVLALGLMLFGAYASSARADDAQARAILKSMTDYLATQNSLSFDVDSIVEIVTTEGSKIGIASSGSVAMERPDKIRIRRHGGFATVEMTFDGQVLLVANLDADVYGQASVSGTVNDLFETLRADFQMPLPAADLLASDAGAILLEGVTEVRDLGSGVIRGEECDHLGVRSAEVDWQIWIAQGAVPHPCRFVITSKEIEGWPQHSLEFSSWGSGEIEPEFASKAPAGAQKVEMKDIPDVNEVAGIFVIGKEN